jgi:hypothetical protein
VKTDSIANLAFAACCVTLTGALVYGYVASSPKVPAPYQQGQVISTLQSVDYRAAKGTVLLVLSSSCGYCTASMPFYQALSANRQSANIRVVAVTKEPADVLAKYLAASKLEVDQISRVQGPELAVTGTPAIIVVGQDSRVRGSWQGLLPPNVQSDVLATIARTGRS